ncbi:BA14K family protein [Bradyrhizobium sp. 61]|nr:BA14K family protein [Bradyrhizobium sp. 61]
MARADGTASRSCAERYRSYDPATGTYLGWDGNRHICR